MPNHWQHQSFYPSLLNSNWRLASRHDISKNICSLARELLVSVHIWYFPNFARAGSPDCDLWPTVSRSRDTLSYVVQCNDSERLFFFISPLFLLRLSHTISRGLLFVGMNKFCSNLSKINLMYLKLIFTPKEAVRNERFLKTETVGKQLFFDFVKFWHNYARHLVGSLISNRRKKQFLHWLNDAPSWPP